MAKRRVVLEADTSVLFDMLHNIHGDTGPLGTRLVSLLLSEPGTADLIAMAVYGIDVVEEGALEST